MAHPSLRGKVGDRKSKGKKERGLLRVQILKGAFLALQKPFGRTGLGCRGWQSSAEEQGSRECNDIHIS